MLLCEKLFMRSEKFLAASYLCPLILQSSYVLTRIMLPHILIQTHLKLLQVLVLHECMCEL
jgi:hypothetical protein